MGIQSVRNLDRSAAELAIAAACGWRQDGKSERHTWRHRTRSGAHIASASAPPAYASEDGKAIGATRQLGLDVNLKIRGVIVESEVMGAGDRFPAQAACKTVAGALVIAMHVWLKSKGNG